ncbi:MAG: membrane lipoprotein lipid attachment site-containing protein [Treponema sp.]|nr:membrane lipoprotein lipid attachment site-containing protein [Treponema sp.]
MKKLLLALSIVLILASCDNGGMSGESNPFIGAWEADDDGKFGGYLFTENEVIRYYFNNPEEKIARKAHFWQIPSWYATYTFTDTVLTIEYINATPSYDPDFWTDNIDYSFKNGKKSLRIQSDILWIKVNKPTFD